MTTILERFYPTEVIRSIVEKHLRVAESDGELYEHAKMCVINAFEAAEDYTNRVIISSLVEFRMDDIEDLVVELPSAPVSDITIRYLGADDEWHNVEKFDLVSNNRRAFVELRELPPLSTTRSVGRVVIEAECGYRDYPGDRTAQTDSSLIIPGAIEQAVALMSGTFFENIADNITGTITAELPTSAKALLYPYRRLPYGL